MSSPAFELPQSVIVDASAIALANPAATPSRANLPSPLSRPSPLERTSVRRTGNGSRDADPWSSGPRTPRT